MMTIYWSVTVWLLVHLSCRQVTAILVSDACDVSYQRLTLIRPDISAMDFP